jgi:hypothetical protein
MDIRADNGRVRTRHLVLVVASVLALPLIVRLVLELLREDRGPTYDHGNVGTNKDDDVLI